MASQTKKTRQSGRGLLDLLALDIDLDATRCVRFKRIGENLSVLAAEILPPLDFSDEKLKNLGDISALSIPKNLSAKKVAMAIPGANAIVKLLNLPGVPGDGVFDKVKEHLGVEGDDFRIGFQNVGKENSRETRLLAVAAPETLVKAACRLFPTGNPAPLSVEINGLAMMTAFEEGPLIGHPTDAVAMIDIGPRASFVACFNKLELVLARKFDFGLWHIFDRIQRELGLDRPTVLGLMTDSAIDVSQAVKEVAEPFIKQMVISRHFVERRENCRITRMYLPCGSSIPADLINAIKSAMGFDVDFWDPFAMPRLKLPASGLGDEIDQQKSRFSAAIGVAIGAFANS